MTSLDDDCTELIDADIPRVDLVDKAANGTRFLIAKQADGASGLVDPGYVRELIGKSEPAEEKVTMTGSPAAIAKLIHQAAQRSAAKADPAQPLGDPSETPDNHTADGIPAGSVAKEMDMDTDDLDPLTALAEPDSDAPGMDTDPGSPAWEAVDAATARKWTAILARAKNAIDMLAERELLEAASADPDDAENAWDLQDACCAIDYAISVLAPFAVAEQAEADCCEDMQTVGKALAGWDSEPLDTIEALGQVRKAGRVLSTSNEAAIRGAVESLQKVLASLPSAPIEKESGQAVADTMESDMPQPETSAETVAETGQEPEMGIAKADGEKTPMTVVYDQKGRLIGIVDPADVTPVSNSEADPDDMADETPAPADDAAALEAADLAPAPAAVAGTPADAVPDDDTVTKNTNDTPSEEVLKSIVDAKVEAALNDYRATQEQSVAQLAGLVETLKGQVKALEEQPAEPRVFTNGAVPPRDMRGMDRGAFSTDVMKAQERRRSLYQSAEASEQNRIANEMQLEAIARLQEIQRG